jgi:hypothetical protein
MITDGTTKYSLYYHNDVSPTFLHAIFSVCDMIVEIKFSFFFFNQFTMDVTLVYDLNCMLRV